MDKQAKNIEKELKEFDFVQFAICDLHGIPRGKLVPRHMLSEACRDGVGIYSGSQYFGVQTELPTEIKSFENFPNGVMRPILGTVHPLTWNKTKAKVGQVLCQLELKEEVFEDCPRLVAQRQVDKLSEKGLKIKSAFECEFDVVKSDTLEPHGGGGVVPYANLDFLGRELDFLTTMTDTLTSSGIHTEYIHNEYQAGQYEVSMQPQWGVGGADDAFFLRQGVKAYCSSLGYTATFMAIPFPDYHSAGFHFNHSIWTQDGQNLFRDDKDPLKLSATARHWLAGLLEHAPALTALTCPTLNCYRRLGHGFAPAVVYWNVDDRTCTYRAKTANDNVYVENRVPSSACNPYIVLAATIAAGLDGIERKLPCPNPGRPERDQTLIPTSLTEALDALEKDEVIQQALGGHIVNSFLHIKRDIELKHFGDSKLTPEKQLEKERAYYMPVI